MECVPLEKANLPEGSVKLAVVDGRLNHEAKKNLISRGIKLVFTKKHRDLYSAVSCHPDMVICHIGGNDIVYAPGTDSKFLSELISYGFNLIKGQTNLSKQYPQDIAYNVAIIDGFAFHNLKYTDPVLKMELYKKDIEFIHVNQGYTKCSVSIVNSNCMITQDKGICKVALKKGFDVLLLENERAIKLPGLDYGFIGGASSLLGPNCYAIVGDITILENNEKIKQFLFEKSIEVVSLSPGKVTDIGSIIPLLEKY